MTKFNQFSFEQKSGPLMSYEDIHTYYTGFAGAHIKTNLELYENYYMYNRGRAVELAKEDDRWRTNIKSPLSHMFMNNVYNMFIDGDQTFNVIVKNPEKYKDNRIYDDMLEWGNYLLSHTNATTQEEIFSGCFDAIGLGTGTRSPYYVDMKNMVKWLDRDGQEQSDEIHYDFPACRYVSPFTNFEVGSSFLGGYRYHIERELVPAHRLEKYFAPYGVVIKKQEIEDNSRYIDDADWESIKKNIAFYNFAGASDIRNDDTYNIKNKMCECIKVTDGNQISLWINSIYHGTFPTLGPRKEIPYIKTTFKKIPGHNLGLGVLYLVKPMQEAFDIILNYRIDNVKLALNKMFFADPSFNSFGNQDRIRLKPGSVIKVSSPDAIREFKMTDVNQSAYQETDAMFQMTQGMLGVSAPNLGLQNKVERVSGGPELYKSSADAQLNQFVRNYARSMAKTMKFMFIYTLTKTRTETINKVLGEGNALVNLDLKDFIADFDFTFDVSNDKLDTQAVKRNQVLQLIQTGMQPGPSGQPIFPEKLTNDLVKSLLKTYNLDIDMNVFDEAMAQKMMTNLDGMSRAVEGAVAQGEVGQLPQAGAGGKSGGGFPDPLAGMRDLQQQGVGGIPPELTTNPLGGNAVRDPMMGPDVPKV